MWLRPVWWIIKHEMLSLLLALHNQTKFYTYTVFQKKGAAELWQYLCQILTDFQNFGTTGKRIKFATKPIRHHPSHLRNVATLHWKIKKSNFSRYLGDAWKCKVHFKCTDFNSFMRVTVYAKCIVMNLRFQSATCLPHLIFEEFSNIYSIDLHTCQLSRLHSRIIPVPQRKGHRPHLQSHIST